MMSEWNQEAHISNMALDKETHFLAWGPYPGEKTHYHHYLNDPEWTPNLPGKRQNCAHGDHCQSCTLPKWLFASKILTLVTSWSGPTGPTGPTVQLGQTTCSYHWPSRPAMHDLETYANVDAHSANPPLVRCFHHRVCLQYFRFIPGTTCWGKSSVMDFGSTINSASCSQPIFFMTAMLPDENCSTSRKQYESNMSIYEPTGSKSWRTKPESYYDDRIITASNSACPRQNATTKLWLCASSRCEHDASTKMPWDVLVRSWK